MKLSQDIYRIHQMTTILVKNGGSAEKPERRMRLILQDLGPTFVKFGQILATRVDLIPPSWIHELKALHDQVPTLTYAEVKSTLEQELGDSPDHVFASFNQTPLAAGSIAQTHRATLKTGEKVIVKVLRPGIEKTIRSDLRLLKHFGVLAQKWFTQLQFDLEKVIEEFSSSLLRELDLSEEAKNLERVGAFFQDNDRVIIPIVFWQYTTSKVNTQQFIDGIAGSNIAALDTAGLDRRMLAKTGTEALLKMIFVDGFFHADPHPGNVIYLKNNGIAFIDFGMVGRLSTSRRQQIIHLLYALAKQNTRLIMRSLESWVEGGSIDRFSLEGDIEIFLQKYHSVPLEQLSFAEMLSDLSAILKAYNIVLPADMTLLVKVFLTLEGFGRSLDPQLDMIGLAEPFLKRVMAAQFKPKAISNKIIANSQDWFALLDELPSQLLRSLKLSQSSGLNVKLSDKTVRRLERHTSRLVWRLCGSIVLSSCILTLALMHMH